MRQSRFRSRKKENHGTTFFPPSTTMETSSSLAFTLTRLGKLIKFFHICAIKTQWKAKNVPGAFSNIMIPTIESTVSGPRREDQSVLWCWHWLSIIGEEGKIFRWEIIIIDYVKLSENMICADDKTVLLRPTPSYQPDNSSTAVQQGSKDK